MITAEDGVGNIITSDELGYTLQYHVIPESLSLIALLLLITATLVVLALHRNKRIKA
jgi:hypothetical protein